MKFVFLFNLIFLFINSAKIYAEDAGIVVKMKGKELVAKIISDQVSLDSKYYYVVDSKNKKVAWLEITKIQNTMGLFKVLKISLRIKINCVGQTFDLTANSTKSLIWILAGLTLGL